MAQSDKKGKKEPGLTKCRGCRTPLGADLVKIGRKPYHPECAAKKPRYRQEWSLQSLQWKRIGVWSDEEAVTLEAHSGG